ncbi:MAG: inositol monophosphatase [Cellulomonadaceae bacterium]|nr:inositol monophosphatase [Cellulomonadaceae bacterium]
MTAPRATWSGDVDAVTALVQQVARDVVAPRFRALQAGDVGVKGADDVVTIVDTEAEAAIPAGLAAIAPGVPVIGEEATAADPSLLDVLAAAPLAWVVDPLDGTRAFVEGSPDHAVMVALVQGGEAVAGWICLPAHGRTYVAQRGSGAFLDGQRLPRLTAAEPLRGAVARWSMTAAARATLARRAAEADLGGLGIGERVWSGYAYARVASGETDALGVHPCDGSPSDGRGHARVVLPPHGQFGRVGGKIGMRQQRC